MNDKKFYSADGKYFNQIRSTPTLTSENLQVLPDAAGSFVLDTATQTLTNKTLTAPTITLPMIDSLQYAATDRQNFVKVVTLAGATIHAGVVALMTLDADILITRVILDVTTKSTGASTVDIGYTAVSAVTASDTFLDGIDTGTGIGTYDSMDASLDSGANAKAQKGVSGKWITIKEASGDTSAMVGKVYIYYTKI